MLTLTALLMTEGLPALKQVCKKLRSSTSQAYAYFSGVYKFLPDLPRKQKPRSIQRCFSIEEVAAEIEVQSGQAFVKALQRLRQKFGPQWPPRASYEDWPDTWAPYKRMAEDLSYKLRDFDNPTLYRQWIDEYAQQIDVEEVVREVGEMLDRDGHNSAVYGLMGALAKLIYSYRWARLPATQEEIDRKTMVFPPHLMKPFEKMSEHYGTIPRGCMFSTSFANAIYKDGEDGPSSVRFFFTTEEDMRHTETSFFNCFTHMDVECGKTLPYMSRYMALTEVARSGPEMARRLLQERVFCLQAMSEHIKDMFKVFRSYINDRNVKPEYWAPYIQGATAWNINGMTEGMSGAETLAFHLLDAFLSVSGSCPIFKASIKKLQTIPTECRDLVAALNDNDTSRFDSFLDLEDDPVNKVKDEMLNSLYMWRLGHAKVPARYFRSEYKTTSGGVVENVGETEGSLVEITEHQLRQRAMETKKCIKSKSGCPF